MAKTPGLRDLLRTPPYIANLGFSLLAIAKYEKVKEREKTRIKKKLNHDAETAFLKNRRWQYEQALKSVKAASMGNLQKSAEVFGIGAGVVAKIIKGGPK